MLFLRNTTLIVSSKHVTELILPLKDVNCKKH